MQTRLADFIRDTPAGRTADSILRTCVHCGFCNATCPTYLLLGNELDGPRGRIYLIKQALEGEPVGAHTQLHLDRCLTCRACETACPSGVEYGHLLDIGREVVEARAPRAAGARLARKFLRTWLPGSWFAPAVRIAQTLRPLLPAGLRRRIPARRAAGLRPVATHGRRVLMPPGCVQAALAPSINAATARVLDRLGIEVMQPPARAGCCGALRHHLGAPAAALDDARRNIDAWWPALEAGAEAIVLTASGCGAHVKDYGHLFAADPRYAGRARRVSALARDISEVVRDEVAALAPQFRAMPGERIVVQSPCTLQHGQKLPGIVEGILAALGVAVLATPERQLCCGSAGTYSMLEPQLAGELRRRKLAALAAAGPDVILSANIGCIAHLGAVADTQVRHWIEWLDARLG